MITDLKPYPEMKDSGVPWLGEVPEHWKLVLLGRFTTRIEQGWSPVAAEGELSKNQWAVLTLSSVRRGTFDATAIKPIAQNASVPEGIEVHDGDLLLTRSNTRDRVGDVCIVEGVRRKTILCDLIYRLCTSSGTLNSNFLMLQLLAPGGRIQIEQDARGSSGTMPKISQRHIRSWRVLLPPFEEQLLVVKEVKETLVSVDTAINRAKREISLLREYRTRLIADVVTGKLDVREAVAKLPMVVDDQGMLTESNSAHEDSLALEESVDE